jgi:hypothetical protein
VDTNPSPRRRPSIARPRPASLPCFRVPTDIRRRVSHPRRAYSTGQDDPGLSWRLLRPVYCRPASLSTTSCHQDLFLVRGGIVMRMRRRRQFAKTRPAIDRRMRKSLFEYFWLRSRISFYSRIMGHWLAGREFAYGATPRASWSLKLVACFSFQGWEKGKRTGSGALYLSQISSFFPAQMIWSNDAVELAREEVRKAAVDVISQKVHVSRMSGTDLTAAPNASLDAPSRT